PPLARRPRRGAAAHRLVPLSRAHRGGQDRARPRPRRAPLRRRARPGARALAELLFDDERAMVRLDMSEYGERHAVARLIGAPPGYVGYEEGGQLTEPVRRRPYSVILFDEVEKANADVWNVLLQVLDDGRLTDGQGRTVDFKNTVIILTSNLGSAHIQAIDDKPGLDAPTRRELVQRAVLDEVRKVFRPEFLNRLDEVVVFNRLDQSQIRHIVGIQLDRFASRLARRDL